MTDTELRRLRQELIARDAFANLINVFLNSTMEQLEITYAEPGMTLDTGVKFIKSPGVDGMKMYHRVYDIAKAGRWLKQDIWLQKRGNSVWMYKYDPKAVDE